MTVNAKTNREAARYGVAAAARGAAAMVITRFAPSPTGLLHVGNLRTALFNALLARAAAGRFLLRIDDTDDTRCEPRFEAAIRADLAWVGLTSDGESRQSDRLDRYEAAAARLREAGRLYPCYETPEELERRRRLQRARGLPPVYDRAALALTEADRARLEGEGRRPHWRFRLERREIAWEDGVLGPSRIDAASVSDPVLIREDGRFLYTLASVVDDAELGITDVVRGADHVTNTATQIQIFEALGATPPRFAHHSLLTAPGGAPLSKREGATALADLRAEGVEPLALVALLARLGSSRDVVAVDSLAEAAEGFDLSTFHAAPAVFERDQLMRLSAQRLRAAPFEAVADRLADMGIAGAAARPFWEAVRPNLDRLSDALDWWRIAEEGAESVVAPEDAAFVAEAMALLPPRPWNGDTWAAWTGAVKAASGRKGAALFRPLRRALTGRDSGPDMAAFMPLLKKP
jgi:glutamyl-tRNA synthetase